MLPDRTWPFLVRPGYFETVDSYLRRLREANAVTDLAWSGWVHRISQATAKPRQEVLPHIAEAVGGLKPGHFARTQAMLPAHEDGGSCSNCATRLGARFECVRCSRGRVEQMVHDGPRVCRRHMFWVGPGAEPGAQRSVSVDILRADRLYRRLRRQGLLDAHRLAEILACVDEWAEVEGVHVDTPNRFRIAVGLAHKVFRPRNVDRYANPSIEPADRYAELAAVVTEVVETSACIVLIDAVWLLIRACGYQNPSGAHSFVCTPKEANRDERPELDQLRTSAYPRGRHLHISQYVSSEHAGTRTDRAMRTSKENDYVCSRGHAFVQHPAAMSGRKASVGCGICSNRRLLRGFNSLADTDPHLMADWHPTKNGDLRPEDVLASSDSKVIWVCPLGHDYSMSPTKRRRGKGCLYCSNRRVHPEINAFSLTHPDVAAEWHETRNGHQTPEHFVAGSVKEAWWRCTEGHEYTQIIADRCRGASCIYCGRQKVHHSTSLAVTHPQVAKRWHPTQNGALTPADVLSGTADKVWWLCAEGHHYHSQVVTQTRGAGCNVCAGRVVDAQNCMRTSRPDLTRQFHPTKNGSLTPDNVMASTDKSIWWLCPEGHDYPATGRNRTRGTGCPYCSNHKVWRGWNDMATTRPDMAAHWDSEKNGSLTPHDVIAGTNKRIHWKCEEGHERRAKGQDRAKAQGCWECYNQKRRKGSAAG